MTDILADREKFNKAFKQRFHTLIRNGGPPYGVIRDTTTGAFAAQGLLGDSPRGSDWLGDDILNDSD